MSTSTTRDFGISLLIMFLAFSGAFIFSRTIYDRRAGVAAPADEKSTDWLLARTEPERARLLQTQLRGFDLAMWEVGERFGFLHDALQRGNYPFAVYQWDKIELTIRNALIRRPGKAEHAQSLFLGKTFDDIRSDLVSADPPRAWASFARAKVACQSCHGAEGVAYVNAHPVFDLVGPADSQSQPVVR
jgi:hypothetical protein